jgi:polygalacturonase
MDRREILKWAGSGVALTGVPMIGVAHPVTSALSEALFDIRRYGATGDGKTLDTKAIQSAIDAAERIGGGTVLFPAGTYASYSIHLKSNVALYLNQGATLLAASVPLEGTTSGGYDAAEPQGAWEPYQDYGHNHWHNSLLWGEELHDIAILGPGRIWGKGLSRGWDKEPTNLPDARKPGVGDKSIALKLCRNVTLRDFQILQAGWFGILATGVDNLTIDNLRIDTNRDGMDIDCCRNVRVSNCTVNSPYDDGICPKSSFALGYARATENVTITNCFVTGNYEVGSVLDGTWKPLPASFADHATGRIKCGTESNGGFRNITISNCVFESCKGFALETADGAVVEDIVFSNIAMRNVFRSPIFLYLGSRMRGPKDVQPGMLRRVVLSNIVSSHAGQLPSLMVGIHEHPIEDIKISDVYLHQQGGGDAAMAGTEPPIKDNAYPEPTMFGQLPATGFYLRHVRNLEVSNVEVATEVADARAAFCLQDVDGADFFRVRVPKGSAAFDLRAASNFRSFGSLSAPDTRLDTAQNQKV